MPKQFKFLILYFTVFISCKKDNLSYAITYSVQYTVEASFGAEVNRIEYLDSEENTIIVLNPSSLWSINQRVKAGKDVSIKVYGNIPVGDNIKIIARFKPDGWYDIFETKEIINNDPNTVIQDGIVEIPRQTLSY